MKCALHPEEGAGLKADDRQEQEGRRTACDLGIRVLKFGRPSVIRGAIDVNGGFLSVSLFSLLGL